MDALASSLHQQLLETTERLVYAHGVHAVGVDQIVRESGVPRRSLYKHFGSKEGLVLRMLEHRHARWMAWFGAAVDARAQAPRARLLALFDVLHVWFASPDFHGCAFINVAGQYADAAEPARQVAQRHKAALRDWIERECAAAGLHSAAVWARRWLVVVDGAIAVALVGADPDAALDARSVAAALLDAALPDTSSPPLESHR
ncbi:transcriptional regulator, TetR family [Caldimonas brevitalea]|uniref:Transcriptional regulator, TetR family n=2 Tax=Caldimonas brevitalea TaxID=413882 RepID=A0A0G3BN76_9BURK|nr:transcriptional regulator, TetR family [Caldimonas brevitalea]